MTNEELNCPICYLPVVVQQSEEGTCSYEPIYDGRMTPIKSCATCGRITIGKRNIKNEMPYPDMGVQ